jgi:DNA-binding CsgD family transcriptional regulator
MRPALTLREAEVLKLLAVGCRHVEVAERLGVSPHTVGSHAKNIYRKLGVRSAVAAVSPAIELLLIGGSHGR